MPNAKTDSSSNNKNNANPSETRPQMGLIPLVERIDWRILSTNPSIDMMIQIQEECVNRLPLREYLANQQHPNQRDPNPNDELLRFSEDDIDSNIDSDVDNDIDIDRDW